MAPINCHNISIIKKVCSEGLGGINLTVKEDSKMFVKP